ncbi:MAG: ribonuclease Y [Spirochaetes bacterium]|nr:MAG: ribonuclease Y [Spirochaetota bacterium]RKX98573.1 MAG: ribonuclease Y [Spirochaetota bacterium]
MNIIFMIILPLGGVIIGWLIRFLYAKNQLSSSEQKALRLKETAVSEAENAKKEVLLGAQDKILEERRQFEREIREQRTDLQRYEKRVQQKEDNLDRKISELEKRQSNLNQRQDEIENRAKKLEDEELRWQTELERISGLSAEEAKKILMQSLENEAKHDAQALINKIEQEAQVTADKKARDILITTIQRLATEVSSEITVTSVSLPNDEMKGRIIGREGRNIRTLETLTGVDIIIDDTPEAVVISCFDPIRKTIAKTALERLIQDGRIHPARIEEVVQKVAKEISQIIYEEGERVLFDLGIHDMRPEGIRALGRLHFRTSYGQNVLSHSKEVAILAGMIASEVGADVTVAKRGALLHDIGKGLETDGEGGHAEIGGDLARRMGEEPRVVNAIAAHHDDEEITSPEGVIVQLADAISAARPGARRETLDNYIKRLENLEKIAMSFDGVDKVFAIQAGRELRIMVNHERINDNQSKQLAKDIAKNIEDQLKFPGRIRVTIIRETRVVEYAR